MAKFVYGRIIDQSDYVASALKTVGRHQHASCGWLGHEFPCFITPFLYKYAPWLLAIQKEKFRKKVAGNVTTDQKKNLFTEHKKD